MKNDPFLIPESVADIEQLIRDQVQENIHLDYKDSRAIRKEARDDIAKDVSAFANSDGGVLIYGVREKDHHFPDEVDGGVDDGEQSREWIESAVIMTRIVPRVEVRITPLPVTTGRSLYVIVVPKSLRGPHQASDQKYYKRYNFKSAAMEDYEIADVRNRRSVHPPLVSFRAELYGRTLIVFEVENIGQAVAQDVQFEFSGILPWPNGQMPQPLATGIPYLHPRQRVRFEYYQTKEIFDGRVASPIDFTVTTTYTNRDSNLRVTEEWPISFAMYRGALVVLSDEQAFQDKMLKALGDINKNLSAIKNAFDRDSRGKV